MRATDLACRSEREIEVVEPDRNALPRGRCGPQARSRCRRQPTLLVRPSAYGYLDHADVRYPPRLDVAVSIEPFDETLGAGRETLQPPSPHCHATLRRGSGGIDVSPFDPWLPSSSGTRPHVRNDPVVSPFLEGRKVLMLVGHRLSSVILGRRGPHRMAKSPPQPERKVTCGPRVPRFVYGG
jgi:hypothetical protein